MFLLSLNNDCLFLMPYSQQPPHAFWKLCLQDTHFCSNKLYQPKFSMENGTRVATAGSCFAQNIGRYITQSQLELVDVEPAPIEMPESTAKRFGYGLFSARYGNIYTSRQLLQLLEDCRSQTIRSEGILEVGGVYFDGLRPSVEPCGFASKDELIIHRLDHLNRIRGIFTEADVFIFTLGLTETWQENKTGLVFPTAPGTVCGEFDSSKYSFINLRYSEVLQDMKRAIQIMQEFNPKLRVLLTVSPVPLTATATTNHVLAANTHSKSLLRTVAGELCLDSKLLDYFPSFEIITGTPFVNNSYQSNLRSVKNTAVETVMKVFFEAHQNIDMPELNARSVLEHETSVSVEAEDALVCEELMLEAFAPK